MLQPYLCLAMYPIGLDPGLDQQIDQQIYQLDLRHATVSRTCLVTSGQFDLGWCFWDWPHWLHFLTWPQTCPINRDFVGDLDSDESGYCPCAMGLFSLLECLQDGTLLLPAMLSPTAPLPLQLSDNPIQTAIDEYGVQQTQLKVPRHWKNLLTNIHNGMIAVKC